MRKKEWVGNCGHPSGEVYGRLFPSLDAAIANGLDSTLRDALAAYPRPSAAPAIQLLA